MTNMTYLAWKVELAMGVNFSIEGCDLRSEPNTLSSGANYLWEVVPIHETY